jgi:hypothetical protein
VVRLLRTQSKRFSQKGAAAADDDDDDDVDVAPRAGGRASARNRNTRGAKVRRHLPLVTPQCLKSMALELLVDLSVSFSPLRRLVVSFYPSEEINGRYAGF